MPGVGGEASKNRVVEEGEWGGAGGGGQQTRNGERGTGAGSLGMGGEMGAVRQERRVQETSLRAQETLWWDLKSKCCDASCWAMS